MSKIKSLAPAPMSITNLAPVDRPRLGYVAEMVAVVEDDRGLEAAAMVLGGVFNIFSNINAMRILRPSSRKTG